MKLLNILIFLIILVNLVFLGYFTSTMTGDVTDDNKIEYVNMTRAIDGDTFVYETRNISQSVRMLGINTQIG
ncbi:MAG: hypothetical protein NT076_05820 [Candidatus Pacearchaeota archaeon]|nr:hypothetical protein [Candidatus Pacearchaeota archaeon]